MNIVEKKSELLNKANKLIDTISESMRMVENVEAAKDKFLRADSKLSLELPVQGVPDIQDVFKLEEIFDENGIDKIKAFILTELELLEEEALSLLERAGFKEAMAVVRCTDNVPQTEQTEEKAQEPAAADPEDDSDMIIIPDKIESKGKRKTCNLPNEMINEIKQLSKEGKKAAEIADTVGVSLPTAKKYMETVPNKAAGSGRSASK